MKLKTVVGSVIALALGLGSVAYASASNYYPPERIHCSLNDANQLSCAEFNRQYLAEDTFTADLEKGKDETFYFASGAAYFTPGQKEVSVFYTYKNSLLKMVKLKTINTSIRPNRENSGWKKLREDIYTCNAGYMQCPITNLPEFSK